MVTILMLTSPSWTWPQNFDFTMANRVSKNFTIEELTASTVAIRNGLSNHPPQKAVIAITTLAQQVLQKVTGKIMKHWVQENEKM